VWFLARRDLTGRLSQCRQKHRAVKRRYFARVWRDISAATRHIPTGSHFLPREGERSVRAGWWTLPIISLAIGLLSTASAAQRLPSLNDYLVSQWKAGRGLPQNTVRCLLQSSNGYLWIGTRAGLARFDGNRFVIFDRTNTPEMPDDNCVALTEDTDGAVWIGTENGLLRWFEHGFTYFRKGEAGLIDDRIRYLKPSPRGGIWIGTWNGLFQYGAGRFRSFTTDNGLLADNIRAVFEDGQGNVWVGSELHERAGNLQELSRTSDHFHQVAGQKVDLGWMVHCFAEAPVGHVWWGNNQGLHEIADGQMNDFGLTDGLSGDVVKYITPAREGGFWVLTGDRAELRGRRGLHRFRDGKATRFDFAAVGIEDDFICTLEDREGSVWVGSRNDGLICLQRRRVTAVRLPYERAPESVQSVSVAPSGSVWFGASQLVELTLDRTNRYGGLHPTIPITVVLASSWGEVWVGTRGAGVQELQEGRISPPGYNWWGAGVVSVLYEDPTGLPWVAADSECFSGRGATKTGFHGYAYFSNCVCRAILRDQSGDMWFGTLGAGAFRYSVAVPPEGTLFPEPSATHGTGVRIQALKDHLTSQNGLLSDNVLSFYQDSDHHVWIGTDKGLIRYSDGGIRVITIKEGLFDNRINCILEDGLGSFWIGCNRGIYRVARQDLNDLAETRTNRVRCLVLDEADGMVDTQVASERQPVAAKGPDGRLWFATGQGLAMVDPKLIRENSRPPPVLIEQVLTYDKVVYGDRRLGSAEGRLPVGSNQGVTPYPQHETHEPIVRLPPGRGRLVEIRYTANSFVAPHRMNFRYRLEGHDDTWRPGSAERTARYTDLPPGAYRFIVEASNGDGVWNERSARLFLTVAPYLYQTRVFYVIGVLGVVILAGAIQAYHLKVQRRVLKLEQQAALAGERARIAQDMHDDIGASLTRIALAGEIAERSLGNPDAAKTQIERMTATSRSVIKGISELVWSVNPRNDTLANFVAYLREYSAACCEEAGLACQLEFPEEVARQPVTAEFRRHLFLVAKEALNNVVKHSGATRIAVRLEVNGDRLLLEIKDNGRGFNPAELNGSGNGLHNMRQRVNALGGEFTVESLPGNGTTIRASVPLDLP
jgi:signal transduction histidine kinase/ligand-binding sensor domain-containing protein